jgi:cobyrinic acid a,c-diamide synthase
VLGAIRRQRRLESLLPDRHLGLVTPEESETTGALAAELAELARQSLDLPGLLAVARSAPDIPDPAVSAEAVGADAPGEPESEPAPVRVRIGVIRDRGFTFYYPENLQALRQAGAELVFLSALDDHHLPQVDALLIGGGFPETQARALADNVSLREAIAAAAADDLPIYAECGGLMYLAESLSWQGETYPMVGVLPLALTVEKRPQGHGYMEVTVDRENPVFPVGTELRGHEFHYSRLVEPRPTIPSIFSVGRGRGALPGRDGLVVGNTLATYLHLHAKGTPQWASCFVALARAHRIQKRQGNRAERARQLPPDR